MSVGKKVLATCRIGNQRLCLRIEGLGDFIEGTTLGENVICMSELPSDPGSGSQVVGLARPNLLSILSCMWSGQDHL